MANMKNIINFTSLFMLRIRRWGSLSKNFQVVTIDDIVAAYRRLSFTDREVVMPFIRRYMEEMFQVLPVYSRCSCGHLERIPDEEIEEGDCFLEANFCKIGIIIDAECLCRDCQVKKFKQEHKPDSLLQSSVYSHGLATGFSGKKDALSIANALIAIAVHPEWEICASWKSQPIGGCGVYIKGDVTVASNMDLWSTVNGSDRVFDLDDYRAEYVITNREELDLDIHDHTEFFVKNSKIVGFWIKEWFLKTETGKEVMAIWSKMAKKTRLGHIAIVSKRS